MNSIKRFFKNKNTVTVLGIIAIVAMLWGVYTYQINKQVKPKSVPVAATTIQPKTQITANMISHVEVPSAYISDNAITDESKILSMYSNFNTVIPAGSMFYTEWLVNSEDLPGNWLKKIKFSEGEEAYYYKVDTESTYGNSILPDSYVDIHVLTTDEKQNAMYGKLFRNIKVLAVHDSNGNNVFADPENKKKPSNIIFALSHDNYNLLKRAEYLKELSDIKLIITPQGENSSGEKAEFVSSATLRDYIDKQTKSVSDEKLKEVTEKR